MSTTDAAWEARVAQLWSALDEYEPEEFVARLDGLVAELPPESAIGLFERGAAQDSTGHPDLAVPLYRAALLYDKQVPVGAPSSDAYAFCCPVERFGSTPIAKLTGA